MNGEDLYIGTSPILKSKSETNQTKEDANWQITEK